MQIHSMCGRVFTVDPENSVCVPALSFWKPYYALTMLTIALPSVGLYWGNEACNDPLYCCMWWCSNQVVDSVWPEQRVSCVCTQYNAPHPWPTRKIIRMMYLILLIEYWLPKCSIWRMWAIKKISPLSCANCRATLFNWTTDCRATLFNRSACILLL